MRIPEVVQLKRCITIVVEPKSELPKSRFIYLCDSQPHLQLWQLKKQIQKPSFDWEKIKSDNAKHSLFLF